MSQRRMKYTVMSLIRTLTNMHFLASAELYASIVPPCIALRVETEPGLATVQKHWCRDAGMTSRPRCNYRHALRSYSIASRNSNLS